MQYLKNLEKLCQDLENVSELIKVLGRSAEDGAEYKDIESWRQFNHEMFGALTFVGIAMRERTDDLWTLLSELQMWSENDNKVMNGVDGG